MFQIKIVDLIELYILCHVPVFCMVRYFWERIWF